MRRHSLLWLVALVLLGGTVSCADSTSVDLLEVDASGVLFGLAFLDNNGNDVVDSSDTPLKGLRVLLTAGRSGAVVREVTTESNGSFVMLDIPVGAYELTLDAATLGDSLLPSGGAGEDVNIQRGDTTRVDFGVSYPVLTVEEVRDYPPGQRVFTSGIAVNPRLSFGDGMVHLQGDSAYLRSTNVARANISIGDSVRFLGRTAVNAGQPILDDVTPFVLVNGAAVPIPLEVATGEAALARGGSIDAALVRVRRGEISDTATVNGNFRFKVNDGTGPIEVYLRSFLQLQTASIRPDTIVYAPQITGLLVPMDDGAGSIRWRILPRGGSDVLLDVKRADVGVGVSALPSVASQGDTVEITVVATNAGPLGASSVAVVDSVPVGLTFIDATTTRGTYDQARGLWTLDSMSVGRRDTLRMRTRVTTPGTGTTVNRAVLRGLVREVDPSPGNDVATVVITIVP